MAGLLLDYRFRQMCRGYWVCVSRSNDQVEGQIQRLKFIRRSLYGRAKFDLLRLRILAPT